ncbi:hypothetical protein OHB49_44285 (plasmid) [Streptomyces sp. NBC_01717]|uniref:hypothetical protein n=1 Tax=Streptomyces sp. NBC_01717 TaxID=2975918 RepID=UPI002E339AC5|nr:hypothetical protein [Streptomyces sp. NBC_01717]
MRKLLSYALAASAPLCTLMPAAHALPVAASTVVVAWDFNSCGYQPKGALRLRSGPSTNHTTLGVLYPADSISADRVRGT